MKSGLKFFAEQIDPLHPPTGLYATMSSYGLLNLEGGPQANELYVVCLDGSIQSVYSPERPIGWELIEDGDEWFYRVTQMNHPRKRCQVSFHSHTFTPPEGGKRIGSVVSAFRRTEEPKPQNAEVTVQKDDGEAEVTSQLHKIASISPLLAHCAVLVNDPVQTEALSRFAEGKMSYAEMRGLCG
jgi:hypothetical protein